MAMTPRVRRATIWSILTVGGLIVIGMAVFIGIGVASVAGIERPEYEVLSEHDGYEVRQYAPHIVAEVTVEGEFRDALNRGFRKLADYIFGNNTTRDNSRPGGSEKVEMTAPVIEREVPSEKIAMTAPVIEREQPSGSRVVSFVMPSKYSLETLPKPNNDEVRLVEVPAKRFAVIRFSGTVSAAKAADMKNKLRELLKRDSIETAGEPMLAQYNPPWTLPPLRRNEVMIELK